MPTVADIVIIAAVLLVASAIYSTVGFGIGLSGTPLLLLFFEPQTTVLVINTSGLIAFAAVAWHTRESFAPRETAPMVLAGLAGVPVGVAVLALASPTVLRIAISALILVLATSVALNVKTPALDGKWSGLGAGFVGSTFINATGIGGPIIALALVARRWPRDAVRCATSAFFLVVGGTAAAGYAIAGLYTAERLVLIGAAAAPVLAGFALSNCLTKGMDEALFRRVVVIIVLGTSSLVLGQEVVRALG